MTGNQSPVIEMDSAAALEYIKVQWADIHHSRLQEWSALGVIGGALYAMVNINATEPKILLGLFGLFSATVGASMAWQHHQIFKDKITVIRKLELGLGIQYPLRSPLFPVQILIFLIFGGIAGAFAGATAYFSSEIPSYANLQAFSPIVGIGVFSVFFIYALVVRLGLLRRRPSNYDSPYYAELDQLESCLKLLSDRPLKLIVDDYLTQPGLNEARWDSAEWTYSVTDKAITKSVLLNQRDVFQFSLANQSSRQDWHYHNHTFEIYVSNEPMDLEYRLRGAGKVKSSVTVKKGALIVPPNLPHKVTLSGTTFVFQASVACKNLGRDKIVVEDG